MITTKKQKDISELIDQKLDDLTLPMYPSSLYEPVRYMMSLGGKRVHFYFTLISSTFRMGAVIAGASNERRQKLEKIGHDIGIAFQIQDDILDVAADPSKFGKKMGGDILEGKKTYLYLLSLKRANKDQKTELRNIFEKPDISAREIQKVIDLYQKLHVIEAAEQIINEHYDQAINQTVLFDNNPYKADLKTYLSNLKNREY